MEISTEVLEEITALLFGAFIGIVFIKIAIRLFEGIRTLGSYKFDRPLYTIWVKKDEDIPGTFRVIKIKSKCAVILKRYYNEYMEEYYKRTIKINDNAFDVFDRYASNVDYIEYSLKEIDEKVMKCLKKHFELEALLKVQLKRVNPPKSNLLKDRFTESLDLPQDHDTEYNQVYFDNPDYVTRPEEW